MEDPPSSSIFTQIINSISSQFAIADSDLAQHEEIDLINNLEKYFKTTISEVMIPRTTMITLEKNQSITDAVALFNQTGYSRIPVQDQKRDNIVGILYSNDLFKFFDAKRDLPVSKIMRKAHFVSYSLPIHRLLSFFREKNSNIAIVVDEHGGVDGIVTLNDVVEELLGEIPHEFSMDSEPDYEQIDEGLVVMDAKMDLDRFNELYHTEFEKEGIETIGGYICHVLGKIPKKAEQFKIDKIQFTVEESSERYIQKLRLTAP